MIDCLPKEPCMNLCCPEGQAYVDSGHLPLHHRCDDTSAWHNQQICQPRDGTETAIQGFADHWKLPNIVNFEGGTGEYCKMVSAQRTLSTDSDSLNVVFENNTVLIKYDKETQVWPNEDACVMPWETPQGKIRFALKVCLRREIKSIEYVYPVLILLSSFFMFLTLAVYLILGDLREQLFGKITVGFLFNVTFVTRGHVLNYSQQIVNE